MGARALVKQGSSVQRDEEQILVSNCRRGDTDAFAQLMNRYERQIYNFTYRMLGSQEEAEDLTQDIFVAAFRGMKGFRAEAKFSTWLYRIALNRTRNRIKYLSRRRFFGGGTRSAEPGNHNSVYTPEGHPDGGPSPEQLTLTKDLAFRVQQCLNQMPPQARQILILRDVQGFSYDELGEMLGLNPGTVKSRLHRARTDLQERLANELD